MKFLIVFTLLAFGHAIFDVRKLQEDGEMSPEMTKCVTEHCATEFASMAGLATSMGAGTSGAAMVEAFQAICPSLACFDEHDDCKNAPEMKSEEGNQIRGVLTCICAAVEGNKCKAEFIASYDAMTQPSTMTGMAAHFHGVHGFCTVFDGYMCLQAELGDVCGVALQMLEQTGAAAVAAEGGTEEDMQNIIECACPCNAHIETVAEGLHAGKCDGSTCPTPEADCSTTIAPLQGCMACEDGCLAKLKAGLSEDEACFAEGTCDEAKKPAADAKAKYSKEAQTKVKAATAASTSSTGGSSGGATGGAASTGDSSSAMTVSVSALLSFVAARFF